MISFLKKLFGIGVVPKNYETQKERLATNDPRKMFELASSPSTQPEILYFLAKSADPAIRKAVAVNTAMPVHASTLLAMDPSVDVRQALAARLCELLPGLSQDRQSQIYAYAVQALGMLAQDEVFSIRRALSTALRDYAKAPPVVVSRLARDVEREVSEPILRFCVALPDDDLLDILSNHPEPWVISTIASRTHVSGKVADAVVETRDVPATTVLVNNAGANIAPETLKKIIDRAREYPEWHKPVALRPELSFDFIRQLAGFVDETVLTVLEKRGDFDAATRQNIAAVVKRRMEYTRREKPAESAESRLKRYVESKTLTPEVLQDALAWHDENFVILALAYLSGAHWQIVKKMMSLNNPRPVVAICWKSKLPMRLCVDIQRVIGKVNPQQIMYGKGGTEYPMSEDDMKWQLDFFGANS